MYLFRIMQNFSGLNRGFAFVQYFTNQDSINAIKLLNNYEIKPGEKIGVVKSRNNCRLYIGKLDTTLGKDKILDYFNNLTIGIVDLKIHDSNNGMLYIYLIHHSLILIEILFFLFQKIF